MAMENPRLEDVFPIEHGGFSNVMLGFRVFLSTLSLPNQRFMQLVSLTSTWPVLWLDVIYNFHFQPILLFQQKVMLCFGDFVAFGVSTKMRNFRQMFEIR